MRYPKGVPHHQVCPKEWRGTPNITGSFELDAVIHHSTNKDMAERLRFYAGKGDGYGERTGYNGYSGYSGDD